MTSIMKKKLDQHAEHCHCGFERSLERLRAKTGKRLGMLGATFMVLHLFFHVVECIIVPAILLSINQRIATEDVAATDNSSSIISHETPEAEDNFASQSIVNWDFACATQYLNLRYQL